MWAQVINAILGIWLMVSPGIFDFSTNAANNDNIIGPVIATFAITAFWECTRVTRLYNIPLGAWLLLAPWVLGYDNTIAIVNDMVVGGLVIALSLVKGKIEKRYGGGWSAIWKDNPLHVQEAKER
jgi:hypothetical protein